MSQWFVLFVVVDIVVTVAILMFVLKRRIASGAMALPEGSGITDLAQIGPLMEFAKERHERIADYVRANWSGMPEQLPGVLSSLIDQLEREAHSQGHTFSRELLKTMVATSLRSKDVARPYDVGNALEKVA